MEDGQAGVRSNVPVSIQVCDRCRWKKIKCDKDRFTSGPCSSCRNANFPCESRVRLSKQSTPRSYVQYLEARVRQLEQASENVWSPRASSTQQSPYNEGVAAKSTPSEAPSNHPKRHETLDWTVLKELGMHVEDEDGLSRYMGPSSGVGFSAMALHEILGDEQPKRPAFNGLFTVDDFTRREALEQADHILWELVPTDLPERTEANRIVNLFFIYTERVFPILHRPSFESIVDELYGLRPVTTASFERLSQFYYCLSIGYCFDVEREKEARIRDQIRNLEAGCRCHFTNLHARQDGLLRLQTLALQAYALIMLRQRSEAVRISAIANMRALECGLHHDGYQTSGNPLDTEMRRRVFWCVFMLHLFSSSFLGLPRALHEADITVAEPSDIDDDCLTETGVLDALPGRTKIHRFVNVCRLVRILSRTLDVLYTHNKRKQASTRIEQMNRLCCEHLLDQLDFSFQEIPDDLPSPDTQDPDEMAILISHANEQLLYYYIRWLIHRPGLALNRSEAQFSSCLQTSTEAASAMLEQLDMYARLLPFIKSSPVAHHMTIFIAALTPLYRTHLLRSQPMTMPAPPSAMHDDLRAVQHGIDAIRNEPYDKNDLFRGDLLANLVTHVFGQDELQQVNVRRPSRAIPTAASISVMGPLPNTQQQTEGEAANQQPSYMDWSEHRLAHMTAQTDLRDLVYEVFSPNVVDPWSNVNGMNYPG